MDYKRAPQKLVSAGLDLNHPLDLMPNGTYPYMKNVRSYRDGIIEGRQGLTAINTLVTSPDTDINSFVRVNDYVTGNFARFLGIGTSLYYGTTSFTPIDSGYSGAPLSFVPYRPNQSPRVWNYIADSVRMRKANTNGLNYGVGIKPPTIIPGMELVQPLYVRCPEFEQPAGKWTAQGVVSGFGTGDRFSYQISPPQDPAINYLLYLSGTTGWVIISPTSPNAPNI